MDYRTGTALAALVDDLIHLSAPAAFEAVGEYYVDFSPPSHDDVVAVLRTARRATEPIRGDEVKLVLLGDVMLGCLWRPNYLKHKAVRSAYEQ